MSSQEQKEYQAKLRANSEYRKNRREYYRKWYAKNGKKISKEQRKYTARLKKINPIPDRASCKVYYAIKMGKIKRPKICENCKEERRILAHHEDYDKPFEIMWLCYSCHRIIHSGVYNHEMLQMQ